MRASPPRLVVISLGLSGALAMAACDDGDETGPVADPPPVFEMAVEGKAWTLVWFCQSSDGAVADGEDALAFRQTVHPRKIDVLGEDGRYRFTADVVARDALAWRVAGEASSEEGRFTWVSHDMFYETSRAVAVGEAGVVTECGGMASASRD
jgi:hypothetical protein